MQFRLISRFNSIRLPFRFKIILDYVGTKCVCIKCALCTAPFVDLFKLLFAVILYNKLVLLTFRHIYCQSKNFQHESSQPSFILSQNFKQSECFEYLLKLNLKLRIPCFPPIIAFVKCVQSGCKCRNVFLQL